MSRATGLVVTPITDADVADVAVLWQRCGLTRPWNDPCADIALARSGPSSTILVGRAAGALAASVLVGHDGHRGWVYYVAVDPDAQGIGFGRAIMDAAEAWLREKNVTKIMLMVRPDNEPVRAFYEALGYFNQPRAVYAKWLDGREPTP